MTTKLHVHHDVTDEGERWTRVVSSGHTVWRRAKNGDSSRTRAINAAMADRLEGMAAWLRMGGTPTQEIRSLFEVVEVGGEVCETAWREVT